MKRVIDGIAHLPINLTLRNVTLPYFAVTKLEWIKDPKKDFPCPDGDWPDMFGTPHKSSIISEPWVVIGYFKKF
jgi:hypothetical protein